MDRWLFIGAGLCATVMTGNALAHIGIARENVFALGEAPREYIEGKTAEIGVQLPHDCSDADGNHFPTIRVSVLFPNGVGTLDPGKFNKNAINSIKARVSGSWRKVLVTKGAIEPYEGRRGVIDEDTRAVHWRGGWVDNSHYDNLYIKASLPKFDPSICASRLEVYIPSVQYCRGGHRIAWIGVDDSRKFQDNAKTRVTEDFAAKFTVVRDLAANPLPAGCPADVTMEAWPSTEDIDKFLPRN